MNEIWKDIKDYEGLYQISSLGNVKSLRTNKILKFGEKECKVDKTSIYKCCTGKQKTAKGFIWRYAV